MSGPRPRRPAILAAAVAVFAASAAFGGGTFAAAPGRTVWDGVYSDAQAQDGAVRYGQHCARCHGTELRGTAEIPSLRGQLIARWGGQSLEGLSDYINRAMPMQAPGALTPEINAAILAYILKRNGAPAGAQPLASDPAALRPILIGARPKALQ